MKKLLLLIFTALFVLSAFTGCATVKPTSQDEIFQVALLQSLTLGGYDGVMTVEELSTHGDTGIGTFHGVNGEMIVLDGHVYQALGDGTVVEASPEETVPFATVSFWDTDYEEALEEENLASLKTKLDALVEENGRNLFYMIRIDGTVENLLVRSEIKQEKPYRPLDVALKEDQREFTLLDAEGTIVALYCPSYMAGINTPGWHFHFISSDKMSGGHLLALEGLKGTLQMDQINAFYLWGPRTEEFNSFDLSQDQSSRIKSVEQK